MQLSLCDLRQPNVGVFTYPGNLKTSHSIEFRPPLLQKKKEKKENETVEAGDFYSKPEPAEDIAEMQLVTIPALTRPRHSFTYSASCIDSTDLNNGTWGYGAPRGNA